MFQKKVWKNEIHPNSLENDVFVMEVWVPIGAKPISVALQGRAICVWFEVDPTQKLKPFTLYSVGTGFGVVPEGKTFLGTVLDGAHVWHIYY